jgi:hypothetical protein
MHLLAELSSQELFDIDQIEIKQGLIQPARLPRSRFFVWKDPHKRHDIIVFIGEAQPPIGKHLFCRHLIDSAKEFGIERVFTFAAMATEMHPEHEAHVYYAATQKPLLDELQPHDLQVLTEGSISGLNGVLLAAAADAGLPGACLLGEMPHIFAQLPFPKASLAVLKAFGKIAAIEIDLTELEEKAAAMSQKLGEILGKVKDSLQQQSDAPPEEEFAEPAAEEPLLSPADAQRIEQMFTVAKQDRAKAFELKQELDRLGVFEEFEDRFLDLFKKPNGGNG